MSYEYSNTQVSKIGGKKITRKVFIKHNKGYKSISHHSNGRHVRTVRKPLTKKHIGLVKQKKFIKGLFKECYNC